MFRRAMLYARTLRHLEPGQMAFQVARRLQGTTPPPEASRTAALDHSRAGHVRERMLAWGAPWQPATALAAAQGLLAGRFEFVGAATELQTPDWTREQVSRLWTYNLHYFDYARTLAWATHATADASYVTRFTTLARAWTAATRSGGKPAWDPYPTSLRIVNWTYALLVAGDAMDPDARAEVTASVHRQLTYLESRIERHILGNHLVKNLAALALGGVVFTGADAARWLATAHAGLEREVMRQVNPDGGHVERSPMYHAIVMADLLETSDVLRAGGAQLSPGPTARVAAMADALAKLSAPDGSVRLFNDSALGIAPHRDYLERLNQGVCGTGIPPVRGEWALAATGFRGWTSDGVSIAIDAGVPSPAYQPAHAHCSALSFELSIGGREIIVDAGVHGYDGDPFREYVRSTRAHNTVMIAGREQSEMWATFRVARRVRMHATSAAARPDSFQFSGMCSPYHDARARHRREILGRGATWTVTDTVEGAPGARLEAFLHFHPDAQVERYGHALLVRRDAVTLRVEPFGYDEHALVRGEMCPVQGWHCPRFGEARAATTVVAVVRQNRGAAFGFRIIPATDS